MWKFALFLSVWLYACGAQRTAGTASPDSERSASKSNPIIPASINMENTEKALFGAGCFWCVEAVFQQLRGVAAVRSGYSGGSKPNPGYKEVCTGTTGHAEVLLIQFDPTQISYEELLDVFWHIHDPTQLNRQGNDIGTQYRSVIYYYNEAQRQAAERSKADIERSGYWGKPIVTQIEAASEFYPAEDYHTDYFNLHGHEPYCSAVVAPKVAKFRKQYADKLKE